MSLLDVSVAAGDSGPLVVLTGEADLSSITQLYEVLTAQVSARTSHLTIDVTDLRSADPAAAQALMLAALIVRGPGRKRGATEPAGAGSPGTGPSARSRDVDDPGSDIR